MIPSFLDVSLLLTLCILFFGWLAAITLDDVETVKDGLPVNEGFTSLGEGIYTMFFVSTTANFPDQMLASYASSRSFGLFFAFYVLLACFIFLNLILAVVTTSPLQCLLDGVDAHRSTHAGTRPRSRRVKEERKRVEGLKAAFALLALMIASRIGPGTRPRRIEWKSSRR